MSAIPRLYVVSDLVAAGFAAIDESQGKYLTRVLRLKEGDTVRLFNGRDGEWRGVIDSVSGRSVLIKVQACMAAQAATPDLILLFAPLKKARTDFVVEKATELGAAVIQPVMTARTQASRVRAERLQKIAIEAAEQTERLDLPVVRDALPLVAALDELGPNRPVFFCDEASAEDSDTQAAKPILTALQATTGAEGALLIGPEGGFTSEERAMLRARPNIVPVTLGPRILRAETAAIAALSLWEAVLGDWR